MATEATRNSSGRSCRPWIALLLFAAVTGCRAIDRTGERAFVQGHDGQALEAFAERVQEATRDYALEENLRGTAALVAGDYRTAKSAFVNAGQVMGSFPGTGLREIAAIVGVESTKLYLGDPYEAAMNSLYTAIACLQTGDEDNARAALKQGILADSGSEEEQYKSDIVGLYLLEALLSRRVGKTDLARRDLEHVRALDPDNPFASAEALDRANTIVVVDLGWGPRKVAAGRYGELAAFRDVPSPESTVTLRLDGVPLSSPIEGVDVDFQARTRGGRVMEGILKGKAVFKGASTTAGAFLLHWAATGRGSSRARGNLAIIGGALLLFGALIQPQADTRHWHLLPARTQLWIGHVPSGLHQLELDFRDSAGRALPAYRQVWHYLPFGEEGLNVYYFRSGRHKGYRRGNRDGTRSVQKTERIAT